MRLQEKKSLHINHTYRTLSLRQAANMNSCYLWEVNKGIQLLWKLRRFLSVLFVCFCAYESLFSCGMFSRIKLSLSKGSVLGITVGRFTNMYIISKQGRRRCLLGCSQSPLPVSTYTTLSMKFQPVRMCEHVASVLHKKLCDILQYALPRRITIMESNHLPTLMT